MFAGAYGAPNKFIIGHKLDDLKRGKSNLGIVNGNDTTISKHPYLVKRWHLIHEIHKNISK